MGTTQLRIKNQIVFKKKKNKLQIIIKYTGRFNNKYHWWIIEKISRTR